MKTGENKPKKARNAHMIHFGSEYDITYDMTNEFPATASKTNKSITLSSDILNVNVGSTFINTQPQYAQTYSNNFEKNILIGSNSPSVHYIDIVSPRNTTPSHQAMSRYSDNQQIMTRTSSSFLTPQESRPQSSMSKSSKKINVHKSTTPNVKAKTYIFGFHEEAKYLPHPFVSSHKPKTSRSRTRATTRSEVSTPRRFAQKPFKLSKRRTLAFDEKNGGYTGHFLGSFDNFDGDHRF